MSNSVNNLKNCVFCLFILCFLSSCVVEERHEINKGTGLEWTFKKYRNGEESFTAAGKTIRGVDFKNHSYGLFSLYSNCYTVYHVTNDTIYRIMDIPQDADYFLVEVVGQQKHGSQYPPRYSSANKHFVIAITYCINQDRSNQELYTFFYRSDGKYIIDGQFSCDMHAVNIDNEYHRHDYIDYYLYRSTQTRKYSGYLTDICAIFNIDGDVIVPLKSYDFGIKHIIWNLADEISNSYYFIATEDQTDAPGNANLYDIFSKTGDLLLSIDTKNEIYVANGKQYEFKGWRREYKRKYGDDNTSNKLWDDVSNNSFHGSDLYLLREFDTYKTYSSGDTNSFEHRYLLTKVDNAFYIIHQYESYDASYVIESIRIPIESLTSNESVSSSSTNKKSALDMVRDVLMTDITNSFFEDSKSYFIQKATIGKRTDTYEKGESFLIIGDNRMTTQWADGSGCTNKMAPKNITIYDLDGEEKTALAYALDDGLAVRAISSGGTRYILLYAYNKSMKSYIQMGSYSLYN